MFSEKELQLLFYMSEGGNDVKTLSKSLELSTQETYRIIRQLRMKDVLDGSDTLKVSSCAFAKRLFSIMSDGPGLARFFSDRRMDVLISVMDPKSLQSIMADTGLSESYLRKVLKIQMEGGVVMNINGSFCLNDTIHPKVRPFLVSILDHLEMTDSRIPANSILLFREGKDVVYSSAEKTDDNATGFSAFEDYGLKGLSLGRRYYTTKVGEMSIEDVFNDAVRIAEIEDNWRLRLGAELFYMKKKDKLAPPKDFVEKHERIMAGDRIKKWPSLQDITDRMWMVES